MRMGWIAALAACGLLPCGLARASVDVELRFWMPDSSGSVQATDGAVGTVLDLDDDLGLDSDLTVEPRVNWRISPRHRLSFIYSSLSGSGDSVVARDITFLGTTYTAATRVLSDVDLGIFRLEWGYNWIRNDKFELEGIFNAGFGTGDASLSAPATALPDEEDSLTVPYLTLGLAARARPVDTLTLFGQFDGLPLGDFGQVLNAEIGLLWEPVRHLGVTIGYRAVSLLAKDDTAGDRVDLKADGLFFGVNGSF